MASSLSLTTTLVLVSVLLSAILPLHASARRPLHASARSRGGFSVELIHRDSPKSPYYNSSSTHYDRITAASHRSMSRADYLFRASSKSDPGFQSQVIPSNFEYLMTLSLGTPPVKNFLIADTGSDIIWTQCKPCISCYKQNAPLFDPSKSSTYKKVGCDSTTCNEIDNTQCSGSDDSCRFTVNYGDGSHTTGVISSDTIGLDSTTGRGLVSIPKFVFGCSTDTAGTFDANSSGLVGLGGGPSSLITQLSSTIAGKFSYCLVPYSNNASATSVLSFGDKAIVKDNGAVTTPLVQRSPSTFYYVTLEDITVSGSEGGEKIAVNHAGLAAEQGNVIVDSGTTLTLLEETVVSSVEKQVSAVVKLPQVKPKDDLFRLCYDAAKIKSDSDLPDITFKYTGGSVKLSPINTFVSPEEGIICLAILPSQGLGVSIIGNIAQQDFHVGYDLQARTLTFAPVDCANL